ncbi:MAG: tRNA preQ1(34) S-adenosylmethionine ribosyltransferase-isomerase QueA [Oscillospiraceae bacterium]|jgi:S-adenosylmethionine:tRNA ribosyltransferase-isomerase|nr:tRNA preQ1(34) S-adenosylmethionine ribosyltransferase-isomerase QueA [Oscillospiraceae bacterium]
MKTSAFRYDLPRELIAQTPAPARAHSRLLVARRSGGGAFEHRRFYDLPEYIMPGDCLVVNNTRVLPARLRGRRLSGGEAEFLLLREREGDMWEVLAKPGRRLKTGGTVCFGGGLTAIICEDMGKNGKLVRFECESGVSEALERQGDTPLPPYITEKLDDPQRYQTVYAKERGSAAAPTAGLHFTQELLDALRQSGVAVCEITLHIGTDTFRPVTEEDIGNHRMHGEYYSVPADTLSRAAAARESGGRVFAAGTTVCRALESYAASGRASGETTLFITPGYTFRLVDALITNFHLPESTLLMLVCAFAGYDGAMAAYGEAVREKYRFYSFGDAMLIC